MGKGLGLQATGVATEVVGQPPAHHQLAGQPPLRFQHHGNGLREGGLGGGMANSDHCPSGLWVPAQRPGGAERVQLRPIPGNADKAVDRSLAQGGRVQGRRLSNLGRGPPAPV